MRFSNNAEIAIAKLLSAQTMKKREEKKKKMLDK